MKKTYVSPLMVEVNVAAESMLATSVRISNKEVNTSNDGVQLGNETRGEWGNLWK